MEIKFPLTIHKLKWLKKPMNNMMKLISKKTEFNGFKLNTQNIPKINTLQKNLKHLKLITTSLVSYKKHHEKIKIKIKIIIH